MNPFILRGTTLPLLASTLLFVAAPGRAQTQLNYVGEIGLFDAEHSTPSGGTRTTIHRVVPAGFIAGYSERFVESTSSGVTSGGVTAWLANSWGRTVRIGRSVTLPPGVSHGSFQDSGIRAMNAHGVALGVSRYGSFPFTFVPWMADMENGTTTLQHLQRPGIQLVDLNDEGWLIAYTETAEGRDAFLAHGNEEPIRIGLTDAAHTSDSGVQLTFPVAINNAGYVIGTSVRYAISQTQPGNTAWVRAPDGTYTRFSEAGTLSANVGLLTESGYFLLASYSRSTQLETISIAHVSGTSRTANVGAEFSVKYLNESGIAAGQNQGTDRFGYRRAFINSAENGTVPIGLPEHVFADSLPGYEHLAGLNAGGYAAGHSSRYGGGGIGWLADRTGTLKRLGLFDKVHGLGTEEIEPYESHGVDGISDSGIVWGASRRHPSESQDEGQDAWIYSIATDEYTVFEVEVLLGTNFAFSQVERVLPNGTVVGTYSTYAGDFQNPSTRTFLWVPGEGVIKFDERIDTSAPEAGWTEYLAPRAITDDGVLVGLATPAYDISSEYLPRASGAYLVRMSDGSEPPPPPPPGEIEHVGRLGYHDTRHTLGAGYRLSQVVDVAREPLRVLGTSALFVGANDVPGSAARPAQTGWIGDETGATRRVGFYDTLHTRDDGRQETFPVAVNSGGVSIGTSSRFAGHAWAGESAWVADRHGTVLKLGYYDAAHTGAGGIKISRVVALNERNKLIGYSLHPDTDASTAWLATSTGVIAAIGLNDSAHTAPDGTRVSLPVALNGDGYVVGHSEFHVPGIPATGFTPWLRSPNGTMRVIGLQSGVHRVANGLHDGSVAFLSENTRAAGHATRYAPGTNTRVGQTAWLTALGEPNRPIGFYTGLHAGANNVAHGRVMGLNRSGYAIGFSTQYPAGVTAENAGRGRTAWIATISGGTVRVGLYDEANSAGPFQNNHVRGQNQGNGVIGTASRYRFGSDRGLDGWYATASGQTTRLGPVDARHNRGDGYARHVPAILTDSGKVAGTSARFNGGAEVGQTAWIQDVATSTYATIVLSVRASDSFAWSVVTELRDDGSAFGIYRKFDSNGNSLGDRAFIYLPGQGAIALESLLAASPGSLGWNLLGRPVAANDRGFVVGLGVPSGSTVPGQHAQGVYLVRE